MSDLDDLLERVADLERSHRRLARENKRLKGAGVLLAVAALSLALLGQRGAADEAKEGTGGGLADIGRALRGEPDRKAEKVVEAEKFLLLDSAKRVRAAIWMAASGPKYDLYDEKGVLRATLALGKNGQPVLMFFSADRKQQVALMVEGGKRLLSLHDAQGRQRVMLGYLDDGGALAFSGEKGQVLVGLGDSPEGRGLGVGDDNGKKRITLELEKGKASLKLFDAKEKVLFEKP